MFYDQVVLFIKASQQSVRLLELPGKNVKKKLTLSMLFAVLFVLSCSTAHHSDNEVVWKDKFKSLAPGLSRFETEKEIERIRGIKSTYDLYAMDTSPWVAYSLDQKTILLVRYAPGAPAPTILDKNGNAVHLQPIDSSLIEYQILQLK